MAAPPSREHTLRSLVSERAPRMAALCRRHRGQPLTDADGQVLKVGSTVVDSKFGEGIARGTEGVLLENQRRRRERANRPASEATMLESHRTVASRT